MCVHTTAKAAAISLVAVVLAGAPAVARASSAANVREVREKLALSALQTIAASESCGTGCQAAYRIVASALPADRTNVLARAILATPNFDYARLARALRIPTIPQIKAQWREWCNRTFPSSEALQRLCFRLILGPPAITRPSA